MTEPTLRKHLKELNQNRRLSWRRIQEEYYPTVPFGTLRDIAAGKHVPAKWKPYFGITRVYRQKTAAELLLLPPHETPLPVLAWQFMHREDM